MLLNCVVEGIVEGIVEGVPEGEGLPRNCSNATAQGPRSVCLVLRIR